MSNVDYYYMYEELHVKQRMSITALAKMFKKSRNTISKNFKERNLEVIRHTKFDYTDINETAFDSWSPEMAYWLGFFAADGSVHKKSNHIHVTLQLSDKTHLYKLKQFLNIPDGCFREAACNYNGEKVIQTKLSFSNKYLKERLVALGMIPRKSFSDINFLNYVPKEYFIPFILGYFDGDGGYSKGNVSFNFCGSLSFLTAIRDVLSEELSLNFSKVFKQNDNGLHGLRWSSMNDVKKLATLHSTLLGNLPLERKLQYSKEIVSGKAYKTCLKCDTLVTSSSSSGLCPVCFSKSQRVVERPSKEKLLSLILTKSFLQIGKEYSVSDNTIRKWCKAYELPHHKKDIITLKETLSLQTL